MRRTTFKKRFILPTQYIRMRATTLKKRFVIEQFNTDSTRWYLYDNGTRVGQVMKTDQTHTITIYKGSALGSLSSADLFDLQCILRQLDSL